MTKLFRRHVLVFCLILVVVLLFLLCVVYGDLITDRIKIGILYARYFITGEKVGYVYVFSAVAQLGNSNTGYTKIVLNVWDDSINKEFNCCIQLDNENIIVKAVRTTVFQYDTPVLASQYECDISSLTTLPGRVGILEKSFCLDAITKIQQSEVCSNLKTYHKIYYPKKNEGALGLCPKIAYDKIDPGKLKEWFEYQKTMGVDKVIIAIQKINPEALQVLEYYKNQGLVEIIQYPTQIPGDVYGSKNRGFEVENRVLPQFFHDEQVSVYHCFSRLQGFEYAAIMDFDEYLGSFNNLTMIQLMSKLRDLYPDSAAFTFYTSFYSTNGYHLYNGLVAFSYLMKVRPRMECQKNVYIPSRTSMASTHYVDPSSYYKVQVIPPKIAEFKKYRKCSNKHDWKNQCTCIHETNDTTMLRFQKE